MLIDRYWKIEEELFPENFFYRHSKLVAPDLIGCYLIKKNNEIDQVKGLIVETEAYSQEEEACHGYRKMTESNKSLFGKPGTFYIYKSDLINTPLAKFSLSVTMFKQWWMP